MEILLIVQIIVVIALVAVILIQKSDSDGFTGNSNPSSFLSGRAQANLFTKTTAILATIFIVNSLVLGYLAAHTERTTDIIDSAVEEVEAAKKAEEVAREIENIEVGVEGEGNVEAISPEVDLEDAAEKVLDSVEKEAEEAKDEANEAIEKIKNQAE